MNEIPKLKGYGLDTSDLKEITELPNKVIIASFISQDSLKEVNDFWDKYKDNPVLFCHNYPEYTTFCLDNKFVYRNCIKLFRVKNIYYRDRWYSWLHDLLYKPKEA